MNSVLSVLSVLWPALLMPGVPVQGAAPRSIAGMLPLVTQPLEPEDPSGGGATRIVGGRPVSNRNAPFVVSLLNQPEGKDYQELCGGSILTNYCVITAGHCATDITNTSMIVRAGSSYLYSGGTTHRVSRVFVHPKFTMTKDGTADYDMAILYVTPAFNFSNPRVQTIEIAHEDLRTGQMVTNYGWGTTSDGGDISYHLRAVTVPVNDRQECIRKYERRGFTNPITSRMFCQGSPGKDHCEGDSGGPAVTQEGDLVGLLSWADGCAKEGAPGVDAYLRHPELRAEIEKRCGI